MAISDSNKTDISFKKLVSVDRSTSSKAYYEENAGGGFNLHQQNIWNQAVPGTAGSTTITKLWTQFPLTKDLTVNNALAWNFSSGGVQQVGFIPPKYGQTYTVAIYDSGLTQILTTDASDWFFDYERGILTFQDTHSFTEPIKITAYQYVGRSGAITSIATSGNTPTTSDLLFLPGSNISYEQTAGSITIHSTATATGGSGGFCLFRFTANGPYKTGSYVDEAWISPGSYVISQVWLHRQDAGAAGSTTIDLNKNGTTLYSTQANRPVIQYDDVDLKVEATNPDVTQLIKGDVITMDIDGVETGTPKNLSVTIYGA